MTKFEKTLRGKPAAVVKKARAVIDRIDAGASRTQIGAKRMKNSRSTLSVALGRSWRLVLEEVEKQLVPIAVRSHEDYSRGAKPR